MQVSLLLSSLPSKPGVYLFKDLENKVLYVGKAKDLKKRVSSYFSNSVINPKIIQLVENIASLDYVLAPSEIDAFLLEANLIKKHKPYYNSRLADDKFFPYLEINLEENPYVVISRKKDNLKSLYLGPYTDAASLKIVYKIMRRIFPFQSVKNHAKKTCLYYHLGLCPCLSAHPENRQLYSKNLKKLITFFKGNRSELIKSLAKERNTFAKNEEFELAQKIQKSIERIELITSEHYDPFREREDPFAYEKKAHGEIEALKKVLIKYFPDILNLIRIECYDISNIQGKFATGSMVVLINGIADKAEYRKFRIKTKNTPDDFTMMKEVLSRRLKKREWNYPSLVVIDGGKGQVSAALEVLRLSRQNIPIVGLAKKEEIIVIPLLDSTNTVFFVEEKLGRANLAVNVLRRIRDEAHRFAISYHRLLRSKAMLLK